MKKDKAVDYEKILLFLLCIAFSFAFYAKTVAIENTNYGLEQLHQYDAELFKNNIMLWEMDFSPRFFANLMVSVLMRVFHMSWAGVTTFIIRCNFMLYAAAAARTACKLTKHRLLFGMILISCIFRSSLGVLAGFGLNGAMDTVIGSGTVLVLFAISNIIGEKKNWLAAWILLALASLMHVHEGMWGGLIVGVLWISFCIAEQKIDWNAVKGLPIYVVVMLMVTVPALMQGQPVDDELFVEIYAHIRTPNHLLPTVWEADYIVKCLLVLLIPTLFLAVLYRKNRADIQLKKLLLASVLTVAVWCAILGLQYYATVITSNATLVTMYMPKCFKYVAYIAMLLYLKIADRLYEEKRYLQAACALMVLLLGLDYTFAGTMAFAVLLLLDAVFGLEDRFFEKEVASYYDTIKLLSWGLLLMALCLLHGWATLQIIIAAILFVVEFALPFIRYKKAVNVVVCIGAVGLIWMSIANKMIAIDENGLRYVSGEECLRTAMGNDIYELSLTFKAAVEEDVEFLADPSEPLAGWVQLISEKDCYAILKCTPSSKHAVIEWYDRITQVENMVSMNDEELSELMEEIELKYVMILPEQYETLENSELFEPVAKGEVASIYRLK